LLIAGVVAIVSTSAYGTSRRPAGDCEHGSCWQAV